MKRPSHKELYNKILQAKDSVAKGSLFILDPYVIAADALKLGYLVEKITETLLNLLAELKPEYYVGGCPPQCSYEIKIKGSELFAFRWVSETFGCDTYFKFALKQENLWIVSLHEHREN